MNSLFFISVNLPDYSRKFAEIVQINIKCPHRYECHIGTNQEQLYQQQTVVGKIRLYNLD